MADTIVPAQSRRVRKKLETRRKIFDAAMKLMSERSYSDVAISEICAEADVAIATFYLHFPTKASLIAEFHVKMAETSAAASAFGCAENSDSRCNKSWRFFSHSRATTERSSSNF